MSTGMRDRYNDDLLVARLSVATGLTCSEVKSWVVNDYSELYDDGIIYGHIVEFSENTPDSIISKFTNAVGFSVSVPPLND